MPGATTWRCVCPLSVLMKVIPPPENKSYKTSGSSLHQNQLQSVYQSPRYPVCSFEFQ